MSQFDLTLLKNSNATATTRHNWFSSRYCRPTPPNTTLEQPGPTKKPRLGELEQQTPQYAAATTIAPTELEQMADDAANTDTLENVPEQLPPSP